MAYTNTELLNANKHTLLSNLDKQRRFLLKMATTPTTCASCGKPVSQVEAYGNALDEYPIAGRGPGDGEFTCPHCTTQLHWCIPFVGAPFWMTERAFQGAKDQENS